MGFQWRGVDFDTRMPQKKNWNGIGESRYRVTLRSSQRFGGRLTERASARAPKTAPHG